MSFAARRKVRLRGSTPLVLFSNGREDERFTVDGKTNLSLVVFSARLWSGFHARTVVVKKMTDCPLLLCERKLRMQHGQVALTASHA